MVRARAHKTSHFSKWPTTCAKEIWSIYELRLRMKHVFAFVCALLVSKAVFESLINYGTSTNRIDQVFCYLQIHLHASHTVIRAKEERGDVPSQGVTPAVILHSGRLWQRPGVPTWAVNSSLLGGNFVLYIA